MANGRVQVQGVGSAPKLQAVVNAGGQYRVQTQQAGRNKLMDLADSLSQVGLIAKEYGALGEVQADIGRQNAATVSDADVMKELKNSDPDTFFTIKRQRAFRNTLLKRAISNNLLPSMQAEADTLLDLDKYKNQNEFMGAVNGFLDTNWESFSEEVGGEVASSDAAKVLWNSVTGPFRNNMLKEYDKKMDAFNLAGQQEQLSFQLDAHGRRKIDAVTQRPIKFDPSGLQEIAQQREKLLIEDGVLDKDTRNKVIVQGFATQLDSLIAAGRYEDADRMLSAMKVIQVKGKPIFRGKVGKSTLNPLEKALNTKLNQADVETDAQAGRRYANRVVSAYEGLAMVNEKEDVSQNTLDEIKDTFIQLNPSLTEEQVEELVNNVFEGTDAPLTAYRDSLKTLANNGGDAADKLWYDNSGRINEGWVKAQERPLTVGAIRPDLKEEVLQNFTEYNSKTGGGYQDFLRDTKPGVAAFPALKALSEELTAGDYVKNTTLYKGLDTRLKAQIKEVEDKINQDRDSDEELSTGFGGNFEEAVLPRVQDQLVKKAKELADEPDADKRNRTLQTYANQVLQEEIERFEKRAEASLNIMSAITEKEIKRDEERGPEAKNIKMPDPNSFSFQSPFSSKVYGPRVPYVYRSVSGRPNSRVVPNRSLINQDRVLMINENDIGPLRISLYRHGFDEYSKDSAALLKKTEMDAGDVSLFKDQNELIDVVMNKWDLVLQKDQAGDPLSDEEKSIRDEFQAFGVFDKATLDLFISLQANLFN